jgi:hypothetical protein
MKKGITDKIIRKKNQVVFCKNMSFQNLDHHYFDKNNKMQVEKRTQPMASTTSNSLEKMI